MFKNITFKLLLLLLLSSIVPLILSGGLATRAVRRTNAENVYRANLHIAQKTGEQIIEYMKTTEERLKGLGSFLYLWPMESDRINKVFKQFVLLYPRYGHIFLTGENNQVIAGSDTEFEASIGEREKTIIRQVLASGRTQRSDFYMSNSLVPVILMGIPIEVNNEVSQVLVGEITLIALWDLIESLRIGETGRAHLMDMESHILASAWEIGKSYILQRKPVENPEWLRQPNALSQYENIEGKEVLGAVSLLPELGWYILVEVEVSEALGFSQRMINQLLIAVFLTILFASLIALFVGRKNIVSPIQTLQLATRAIGEGKLDHRVHLKRKDELGVLAQSINEMAGQLQRFQQQIRQEERFSIFGRIAAGLVHDLKVPLGNIETTTSLLKADFNDQEIRDRFATITKREFFKLNGLLDNLRNLVQPSKPMLTEISINSFLDEILDSFKERGEQRSIALQKEYADVDVTISADRFALTRVFTNLIDNAFDAMQGGGSLTIRTRVKQIKKWLYIEVQDTGSGIPEEHLKQVFTDFRTTKRSGVGLGLGLAIANKLASENNALIHVTSEVGKGTCFMLIFAQS